MNDSTAKTDKPALLQPDICVIGGGAAGLAVASAAAAFGVSVVLVERRGLGGNRAGLARRALIAAADRAHALREAGRLGIEAEAPQIREAALHGHVRRCLAADAVDHSAERLGALGVRIVSGEARFASRSTVMAGDQAIKARRVVIATGSRPDIPDIPGLAELPVLTEDDLHEPARLPARPVVIGGGETAVALAQAMNRLGCTVDLVALGPLLPSLDAEAAALVRRALLREGVRLHEEARAVRAEAMRGGVRLMLATGAEGGETAIEGSHLVVAAGRRPDIATLDLELAGIARDEGGVAVDRGLRTINRRVYAIGDCAGGMAGGAHYPRPANDHASLVLRNALFRLPVRIAPAGYPRVAYSRPEIASLGLSEAQARSQAGAIRLLRWPFSQNEGARAEGDGEGFVKVVTDKRGRILGVTIAGAGAEELIAPWSLALRHGMAVDEIARTAFPDGAMAATSGQAALSFHAPLAGKPGIRRLLGFLRRFG